MHFIAKEKMMTLKLTATQARVIGCLMEKEVTTPDNYPLTLNSLQAACNQKSNREPVMDVQTNELQLVLTELVSKNLVTDDSGFNTRAAKYTHRFCNTEFGDLKLDSAEKAVVCVLLLRGAQTPGELRSRCQRMYEFSSVDEVEKVLEVLCGRDDPLVKQLSREPGKRESRFVHLFSDLSCADNSVMQEFQTSIKSETQTEIEQLQQQVLSLQSELAELKLWVKSRLGE